MERGFLMKTRQSRSFSQCLNTRTHTHAPFHPSRCIPLSTTPTSNAKKKQEAIEPRVSDIAHAALAPAADVTHAQSEQLSGANKVAFIEERQQGGLTLRD